MSFRKNMTNQQETIQIASALSGDEQETFAPFCYWFEEGIQMDRRAASEEVSGAPAVASVLVAAPSAT
jgi:hypothetical protein